MSYLLSEICQEIGIHFDGDDVTIEGIHTLAKAGSSELSFINSEKYLNDLSQTKAAAVILESKYINLLPSGVIALAVDDPYLKLALASKFFRYIQSNDSTMPLQGKECSIDGSVRFGAGVVIGDRVSIMAGSYIGDGVTIGNDSIIYPNTTLYHHVAIGSECILHSGVVVGADGFGFAKRSDGKNVKIYQNGNVIIEDSVEIGANTTVDRAVFGSTVIGSGTKIDNQVQVGHNCEIGKNCLIVGYTALSGSTKLGDNITMGGQSGTTGHLEIGSNSIIASRAGVTKSLEGDRIYSGFPAIEHKIWLRMQAKLASILKKR
jgi:UDP-3-O-[3-hydroxymyristoyl] glucosamine N-acyltransferase